MNSGDAWLRNKKKQFVHLSLMKRYTYGNMEYDCLLKFYIEGSLSCNPDSHTESEEFHNIVWIM